MDKTVHMQLIEREFGKPLEQLLSEWRASGSSIPGMATAVRERGIPCSAQAIRLWINKLGGREALVFPCHAEHEDEELIPA